MELFLLSVGAGFLSYLASTLKAAGEDNAKALKKIEEKTTEEAKAPIVIIIDTYRNEAK